jgi:hypothetical protein
MKTISPNLLHQPTDYPRYRQLIDELLRDNKTTGLLQNEAMLQYTRLNVSRMNRLDKTTRLSDATRQALNNLSRPLTWLVITEAWCGDAAQIVPVLAKMAELTPMVDMELILRDDNPDIMDAFLTNGAQSIPKVIILDGNTREVLGSWGPRPEQAQKMMMNAKARAEEAASPNEKTVIWAEAKKEVQKWYAHDKTQAIQADFLAGLLELVEVTA